MGRKRLVLAAMSTVMMISLLGCSGNPLSGLIKDDHLVAAAIYPKSVAYDDYEGKKSVQENNPVSGEYLKALNNFSAKSTSQLLSEQKKTANTMYSPISLYMALALAASGAKNQTQDEILSVLNMKDLGVNQLEAQTGNLFRLLYTDNKIGKLRLANSLWMDKSISFNKYYLDTATKDYYASLFSVDFSDKKTGDLISKWISENTDGLLNGSNSPNGQQIMSIINTIYFYDEWVNRFDENQTTKDSFYGVDGKPVMCDFMNMSFFRHSFIDGEGFISSSIPLKNQGSMNFYLPDKGVDVYDLISTPEKMNALLDRNYPKNLRKNGQVVFKLPKFDFGSTFLLNDSLKKLGMKSAFESNADFSGLTNETKASISKVLQETHISIDEKGCEAAAYTKIDFVTSAPSPSKNDYAEMILDRPFIFSITSNNVVLFMGIINNPVTK